MPLLIVFLYVMVVVVSLLLIGIILIQPAKSGGMGAAFGGIGESVFGAKAGSHLTRATVIMTAVFFVVALILAALIGHGARVSSEDAGVSAELRRLADGTVESAPVQAAASEAVASEAAATPTADGE